MEVDFSEYVYYSEDSPTFLRRSKDIFSGRYHSIKEASVGDVAGSLFSDSGYSQVRINRKLYLCHVIVWNLHNGKIPEGMFIDHLNGDRQDNTSGFKGVTLLTNKYPSGSIKQYWAAFWNEGGRVVRKFFSVDDLGFDTAKLAAINFREGKIDELNLLGYGYTERHLSCSSKT